MDGNYNKGGNMQIKPMNKVMQQCKVLYRTDPGPIVANQIAVLALSYPNQLDIWLAYFQDIHLVTVEIRKVWNLSMTNYEEVIAYKDNKTLM